MRHHPKGSSLLHDRRDLSHNKNIAKEILTDIMLSFLSSRKPFWDGPCGSCPDTLRGSSRALGGQTPEIDHSELNSCNNWVINLYCCRGNKSKHAFVGQNRRRKLGGTGKLIALRHNRNFEFKDRYIIF